MKDNTLVYLGLGAVALILLSKKKTTLPVYPGTGVTTVQPVTQPSQGVLLPILSTVATLAQNIFNKSGSQTSVSQGYNADGTINYGSTTQDSINQLDSGGLTNTVIPVLSTQTSSPDLTDNTDPSWTDFLMV